jgi:hypothetical protein
MPIVPLNTNPSRRECPTVRATSVVGSPGATLSIHPPADPRIASFSVTQVLSSIATGSPDVATRPPEIFI